MTNRLVETVALTIKALVDSIAFFIESSLKAITFSV